MKPITKLLTVTALSSLICLTSAPSLAVEGPPAQAGIEWRGADGSTALQWAVYDGDTDRVKALIKAGADVNIANEYGSTAMQLAAEVANVEMIKLLLNADADANSPNPEGQTALMLVARTGSVDAAKLLVKAGANVNAIEGWGEQSALMWAAARRHPAMMDYLLDNGADIDARSIDRDYRRHLTKEGRAKSMDRGGLTALMFAIRENCKSCVEVLIDHGANLDKPDPEGVSPLTLAIMNTQWDIAKSLLDAGADVQQWDIYGHSALHAVITRRENNSVNPLDPLNETNGTVIMDMLLAKGANPNMQLFLRPAKQRGGMSRGTTPLIVAAGAGDVEAIKRLLEYGAKADIRQADLQTTVSAIAGARGNPDSLVEGLQLLVDAGADVNVRAVPHHLSRTRGGTPLHYAVNSRNEKMISALVAAGADVNGKDVDGLTALDYAMARGHLGFQRVRGAVDTKLADLLRSLGATEELDDTPYWVNVGPPFFYPWSVFPLDPDDEANALVPGSFDHQ